MVDYAEKRNFQRMTLDCTLEYRFSDDEEMRSGSVKNLSATGVMFVCDQSISPGTNLVITLTPENTITPPMTADIVITRCDPQENSDYLLAGEISKIF